VDVTKREQASDVNADLLVINTLNARALTLTTVHQTDERYGASTKTLCCLDITPRRLRKMAVSTNRASVDCPLCLQIRASREKMDAEVANGTFWNRFR